MLDVPQRVGDQDVTAGAHGPHERHVVTIRDDHPRAQRLLGHQDQRDLAERGQLGKMFALAAGNGALAEIAHGRARGRQIQPEPRDRAFHSGGKTARLHFGLTVL